MIDNNNIITETYQNHNNNECLNTDTPIMVQDPSSVLLEISRHGKIYQTNFFKSLQELSDRVRKFPEKRPTVHVIKCIVHAIQLIEIYHTSDGARWWFDYSSGWC